MLCILQQTETAGRRIADRLRLTRTQYQLLTPDTLHAVVGMRSPVVVLVPHYAFVAQDIRDLLYAYRAVLVPVPCTQCRCDADRSITLERGGDAPPVPTTGVYYCPQHPLWEPMRKDSDGFYRCTAKPGTPRAPVPCTVEIPAALLEPQRII